MKFNIDVDCTPEEIRRLVGLPDLSAVHDHYLDQVKTAMAKGVTPDLVEGLVRNWVPMGGAGVDLVKDMIGQLARGSANPKTKKRDG